LAIVRHLLLLIGFAAIAASATAAVSAVRTEGNARPQSPPGSSAAHSTRSVWDGVYTKEQSDRGKTLYTANCLRCHGESLEGGGPVRALTGLEFAANWNGVTMADLVERTRISMPLDGPGVLSRQQVVDVIAFVLNANKFPAGETELPRQAEILGQIMFLSTKPS
jgi:quinoprotein glucose dehydrogenase